MIMLLSETFLKYAGGHLRCYFLHFESIGSYNIFVNGVSWIQCIILPKISWTHVWMPEKKRKDHGEAGKPLSSLLCQRKITKSWRISSTNQRSEMIFKNNVFLAKTGGLEPQFHVKLH